MAGAKNKYQIDMCRGPLFSKIVVFSVPLMLSGILQLLFNAADLVVIGRYAPHEAMAAVGATASLTQLIVTVFMGLSVGTNVLVANYYGAKNRKNISRTVHTAILLSLAGGAVLAIAGIVLARPMLTLMGTPENVLAKACVYMWIYFAGMPCIMLYNFGSAVLRAVGDTRRPLIFLLLAGLVNVGLNLFFVLVFGMDVGGVALATVSGAGDRRLSGAQMPDEFPGRLPGEAPRSADRSGDPEKHVVDRFAGGDSGGVLFAFQHHDPVFGELLRFTGDRGQYGGDQPGGLRLYRLRRFPPDGGQLCRAESGRTAI